MRIFSNRLFIVMFVGMGLFLLYYCINRSKSNQECEAIYHQAVDLYFQEEYEKAIDLLTPLANHHPEYFVASSTLSWIYSTCPLEKWRNAEQARKYADQCVTSVREYSKLAFDKDSLINWMIASMVAAADAENDDFNQAVKKQETAIKLGNQIPDMEHRDYIRARLDACLKLYREKMKLRTTKISLAQVSDSWVNAVVNAKTRDELPQQAE